MFGIGQKTSDLAFYDAFSAHAARSVEASRIVYKMVAEPDNVSVLARAVQEAESAGDKITHETIARLHQTWLTPIDRADIHSLITSLDDVLDLTEAVSERLLLYGIVDPAPDFVRQLADVLVRATMAMEKAVRLLPQVKKPKEMLDLCVEINRLENEADDEYRRALAELFKGGFDALTVLKWRDIIDNLESATDRCEDVANILEGIVLEYA
jgi:predicted phosphate transport protein (TIGR00153 family)